MQRSQTAITKELHELYQVRKYIAKRIEEVEAEMAAVKEQLEQKKIEAAARAARRNQVPLAGGKVLCVQIAPFIRQWIDEGRTLVALAEEAMVSEKTVRNILAGKNEYTYDSIADRVMTAMGHQHTALIDPPVSLYYEE